MNEDLSIERNPYIDIAKRAALLCKCDLLTNSVFEMPELQGVFGYYLALHNGEYPAVAIAIKEHYLPKFEGDALPTSIAGMSLAIADRIDTILGFWHLGRKPTGQKDPYAIRRQAIAILTIIIEKKLNLDLKDLFKQSVETYHTQNILINTEIIEEIIDFFIERLRMIYKEKGLNSKTIEAVLHSRPTSPIDIDYRLNALESFSNLPMFSTLIDTYKRAKNIIKALTETKPLKEMQLLNEKEKALLKEILCAINTTDDMLSVNHYSGMLALHANLSEHINNWLENFDYKNANEQKINNRSRFCQMYMKIVNHVYSIDCLL